MRQTLVVDASVAAKLFLPEQTEPYAAEAVRSFSAWDRGEFGFIVPDHF